MSKRKKEFFDVHNLDEYQKQDAPCPHFSQCGGCRFQNIVYEDQVVMKQKYLETIFKKSIPVHSASNSLHYRNRMDFIYYKGSLALRKRKEYNSIIPLSTCLLLPEFAQDAFLGVQKLLSKYLFSHYDVDEKIGFLRYVVFRMAPSTKQLMLIITTTSPDDAESAKMRRFLSELESFSDSVYWYVYDDITDVSIPPVKPEYVWGNAVIEERIGKVMLTYGPKSFFQSNTEMTLQALKAMKPFVSGNLLDVCCGVGTIGLFLEEASSSLTGVEVVDEAIVYAKKNAQLNDSNGAFFCDDMKNIQEYTPLEIDTVVLDPPRAGVGKKTLKRVLELLPEKIVYLSCNPKTQKLDLEIIKEKNPEYEIVFHEGFDFFPQTPHVEALVVLKRS